MSSFDISPIGLTAAAILSTSLILVLSKRHELIDMGFHKVDQLSQLFPPKPKFTEKNLPDLAGKVTPNKSAAVVQAFR